MPINFPDAPSSGDTHTVGDKTWTYDGTAWNVVQNNIADHGNLGGLGDDDHTQYALADGTRGTFEASGAVSTHEAASDPHNQYLLADGSRTATELTVSGDLTVDTNTLHVDSTNNRVGIGTTSPTQELHIYTGSANADVRIQGDPSGHMDVYHGPAAAGLNATNAVTMQFGTSGNTRMAIDSSGKVGIGTTTPAQALDVVGNIAGSQNLIVGSSTSKASIDSLSDNRLQLISDNATGRPYISFYNQDASGNLDRKGFLGYPTAASNSSTITLFSDQGDLIFGAGGERVRIKSDGKVGIGTTSPATHLEVESVTNSGTTPTEIRISANDNNSSWSTSSPWGQLSFWTADGSSGGPKVHAAIAATSANTANHSSSLSIATDPDGNGLQNRMTVASVGGVGIGTTAPQNELHVSDGSSGATADTGTYTQLVVEDSINAGIHLISPDTGVGRVMMGTPSRQFGSLMRWDYPNLTYDIGTDIAGGEIAFRTGNFAEKVRIESSGLARFNNGIAYPLHAFRVYYAGTAIWTGPTTIVFNTKNFDSGNNYSTSSGLFTAPVTGYYFFSAHMFKFTSYNNSTNTYWGLAASNGYETTTNHGASGSDGGQVISAVFFLSAGDSAYVQIKTSSTMQAFGSSPFNSFTGYLISRT